MRLGQLSRKLDVKPSEIVGFIREQYQIELDSDLNTRIEDSYVEAVSQKFGFISPVVDSVPETPNVSESLPQQAEPVVAEIPVEEEIVPVTSHTESVEQIENDPEKQDEKDTFTPLPVDPDAELIKAPKIKLEGLKVVGKIDLPEPKAKEESDTPETASTKENRSKKVETSEEDEEYSIYKDKKGIYHFSQTQRDNRKSSLERIKREKQETQRKQSKVKHYQQLVVSEKVPADQAKKMKKSAKKEKVAAQQKPERKGLWGKFMNWLND